MALSGKQKAAILLSLLGPEESRKILELLPPDISDIIGSNIRRLPPPGADTLISIVKEIQAAPSLPAARHAPPRVEPKKPAEKPGVPGADSKVLASRLFNERPQTAAYILSNLPNDKRVEVLQYMPERRREIEALVKNLRSNPFSLKLKDVIFDALVKG